MNEQKGWSLDCSGPTTSLKPLQHVPQIIWLVEYILAHTDRGSNIFTGLLQQPCEHIMYLSMRLQRGKHSPNSSNATHLSVLPAKPKLTQEERMNE
jgi:hypothetical protein